VACRSWCRIDFCINQERQERKNDEIVSDSAQPFEKSRFVEEMNLDFPSTFFDFPSRGFGFLSFGFGKSSFPAWWAQAFRR
jgi:hypothetical protein